VVFFVTNLEHIAQSKDWAFFMEKILFTRLLPRFDDTDDIRMQGSFDDVTPEMDVDEEGVASFTPLDPLQLEIEDDELVRIVDDYVDDYDTFYTEKYDLFERRKQNELHLFGRHVLQREKDNLMKDYESRYQDNVLYEIEGTIKPLGMARMPDLMCLPGNDSEEAVLTAQEVGKAIDSTIKKKQNRFVLGLAFKHFPCYFISCIKARWNPEINDYVFECIHPDLIEIDHTSPTKNADDMKFISQIVPLTVQEIILRFPQAKEKFYKQLRSQGWMSEDANEPTWAVLGTIIRIREVWFTEYRREADNEVEKIDGVLWKYKDVILHKMKNPNFDYEGETRYFAYDDAVKQGNKRGLNEDELYQILLTGQLPDHVQEEQVYHNYFDRPRKPFYFMGYDQWGKQPMDETSRIEQNLQNQKSLDKRGKQIEETLDNRGHHIFSKGALTPGDVEEMDMTAPNVDLSVEGDVDKVHAFIAPERPTPAEFEDKERTRDRMYAISHSNAVRGEISKNAATNTQIGRESDFTAADDLVEDTINDAAQWMADWSMQFIKLRYTQDHFKDILGVAGQAVWIKLNRNMIADGMIIKIKASGTDKLRAQNNAMDMAKMQMIDPYTFFVDMGLSDPEGRTEKLILAKTDPVAYLQKVVKGLNTSEALAQALMRAQMPLQQNTAMLPQVQGSQPNPVMNGQSQQQPSPQNTAQVPAQPPAGAPQGSPRMM